MQQLDPARTDLAAEFKRNPIGPHSPDLMQVLRIMHWDAAEDRFIALQPQIDGAWYLARTRGGRGVPLDVYMERAYTSLAEAQWAIFQKRWERLTGRLPVVDDGDERDPSAGAATPSDTLVRDTLTGYSDRFSARPGESLDFKLSASRDGPVQADIVRLRCGDAANDGFKQQLLDTPVSGNYAVGRQPINPGSYMQVDDLELGDSMSASVLVWPTLPGDGTQCVLGQWDHGARCGAALVLDASGAPALWLGDGEHEQVVTTGVPLLARHWYRLMFSVDTGTGEVWVAHQPLLERVDLQAADAAAPLEVHGDTSGAPFRVAAASDGRGQRPDGSVIGVLHFNGKIEAPSVYASPLEMQARAGFRAGDAVEATSSTLLGRWDFSRDMASDTVPDLSVHGRPGMLVNMPTRAMKGAAWDGSEYNWAHVPSHYAAVHFHDDDLHDCGWRTDFRFDLPDDLPSGLYAAWLRQDELEDWIPFVVSPPAGAARAPLALVLPTTSYWAYANRGTIIDFVGREQVRNAFTAADATALYLHHHPELGLSMYDTHRDGSGVCLSSRLRPVLSLRPKEVLWQLPADTHLIDWLEHEQIAFDVLTEDDLDRHGHALLAPYRCVMTGTHPEYPSLAVLDAYASFQARGGRFMYMGGNGFYWRVSFHPQFPGIMEMRRGEDGIRAWLAEGGEYYHAFTGELGGMWRRMGRAPQSVAGTGMTAQGFDRSTWYMRTPQSFDARARFIFEGIGDDERIGDFGVIGGGAAGWEIDRVDTELGTPPHALVVARAEGFSPAYHWMKEELTHTHAAVTGDTCPHVHCDMVFYETLRGGAVFSTSSIAWAGALSYSGYDNNVARITANVVRRFLDPEPFS